MITLIATHEKNYVVVTVYQDNEVLTQQKYTPIMAHMLAMAIQAEAVKAEMVGDSLRHTEEGKQTLDREVDYGPDCG